MSKKKNENITPLEVIRQRGLKEKERQAQRDKERQLQLDKEKQLQLDKERKQKGRSDFSWQDLENPEKMQKMMKECRINGKPTCPVEYISGEICTYCKVPDLKDGDVLSNIHLYYHKIFAEDTSKVDLSYLPVIGKDVTSENVFNMLKIAAMTLTDLLKKPFSDISDSEYRSMNDLVMICRLDIMGLMNIDSGLHLQSLLMFSDIFMDFLRLRAQRASMSEDVIDVEYHRQADIDDIKLPKENNDG